MSNLISAIWWKAALIRALRTALVIAVPYFGGASVFGLPWLLIASAAAMGFLLSLITSTFGIAEASGNILPLGLALLERVAKTVMQALIAGIGSAYLLQDVDWPTVLQAALIAGLGSLVLGVIGWLPESTLTPDAVDGIHAITNVTSGPTADEVLAQHAALPAPVKLAAEQAAVARVQNS